MSTKTTKAKTKQEVEDMTSADRLYDSLSYAYGQKRKQSDEAYDQAISQTDRQLQSRGMGRSSYGAQTLANMQNKKIEAGNDIENQMIADYENRLSQQEQLDAENERWERQFAATQEQNAWQREFQQKQADISQQNTERQFGMQEQQFAAGREDAAWSKEFQQRQFEAGREDTAWNREFQQRQADIAQQNTERQFGMQEQQFAAGREDAAWNKEFQQQQFEAGREDAAWNKEFQQQQANISQQNTERQFGMQEQQFAANQEQAAWQREFQQQQADISQQNTERQFAANQDQAAWQREFNERQFEQSQQQWEAQQAQWREEFEYGKMSAEQQYNYNWVTYALQNGKDVSDDLLAKAGLSRDDFNSMKAKVASGGGSGTPAWKQAGFASKAEYEAAQAAGINNPTQWEQEKFIQMLEEADRQNKRNDQGLYGKAYF